MTRGLVRGKGRPAGALEQGQQSIGNEAGPRGIDVTVALRMLAMGEEALRHDQMQIVLGARHRDI